MTINIFVKIMIDENGIALDEKIQKVMINFQKEVSNKVYDTKGERDFLLEFDFMNDTFKISYLNLDEDIIEQGTISDYISKEIEEPKLIEDANYSDEKEIEKQDPFELLNKFIPEIKKQFNNQGIKDVDHTKLDEIITKIIFNKKMVSTTNIQTELGVGYPKANKIAESLKRIISCLFLAIGYTNVEGFETTNLLVKDNDVNCDEEIIEEIDDHEIEVEDDGEEPF